MSERARPGVILQHGAAGPPGVFGEWLAARGHAAEILHPYAGDELGDPRERQFVVSLGSERSVRDTEPEWIPRELRFLRDAVADEVPVLGLCFGGQALSTVLGGGVDELDRADIGWRRVRPEVDWLASGPWLQYHREVLRVPDGAECLASDDSGPAAFRVGPHVGTQFHPEVTPAILERWVSAGADALAAAGTRPETVLEDAARCAPAVREAAFALFDEWWRRGPARSTISG